MKITLRRIEPQRYAVLIDSHSVATVAKSNHRPFPGLWEWTWSDSSQVTDGFETLRAVRAYADWRFGKCISN